MSSLASLEEDMTSRGAFNHLTHVVLPNDTLELQTFFHFNGMVDLYDFMSSSDSDFKAAYSPTLLDPNPTVYLLSTLVKKLLSNQLWHAMKLSESEDDFEDLESFFGLTVETLNSWHRAQNDCCINAIDNDNDCSANFSLPSPLLISTPPISSPVYVASALVVPSFCSKFKINIFDYPKLKEESQWRAFNQQVCATAASHYTLDILNSIFPPLQDTKLHLNRS
jgi:hypothetical protein